MPFKSLATPNKTLSLSKSVDAYPVEADEAWRWPESNRRPPACKAGALPTELHPRITPSEPLGLSGFAPETSPLSGVRSIYLSYSPSNSSSDSLKARQQHYSPKKASVLQVVLRKEVIQPHVPVRLPCYDLAPITDHTFVARLPCGLAKATSGTVSFRGLTGGVYKARERIHRGVLIRDY